MRKSIAMAAAFLVGTALLAQEDTWVKADIVGKDGKKSQMEILINKELAQGTITYRQGQAKMTMKKGTYTSVKLVNTPKEILEAKKLLVAKKFIEAANDYQAALEKYKHVGFELDCLAGAGEGLLKGGKPNDAISILTQIVNMKDIPPEKENVRQSALGFLQQAYVDKGDFTMADKIMGAQGTSKDDKFASQALMRRGEMLRKQKLDKNAVLAYMKVALLFPKDNKDRPQAIYEVASLLKSMNDARWQDWAKRLQTEDPNNPLNAQLK